MKLRNIILSAMLLVCTMAGAQVDSWYRDPGRSHNRFAGGYMWQGMQQPSRLKAGDGVHRMIVIPAQFSDVSFFYSYDVISQLFTADNYTSFGAQGSVREYLSDQLRGGVEITVAPIVTVSREREYYGGNDKTGGNDLRPASFVAEAVMAAASSVDFSIFDGDGDGYVDNVLVIYAGEDEAQASNEHPEFIWAHSYNILHGDYGSVIEVNGVKVNNYSCASELCRVYDSAGSYENQLSPIGTICHEYLHNFGLVDLYDTDYARSGGTSAGTWGITSLMDSGNYNNYGTTPPNLNAIELERLGVIQPQELAPGDYTLYPLGTEKAATYALYSPDTRDEYYLFEARTSSGWDSYIGLSEDMPTGMLVYHIDKRAGVKSSSETYGDISNADRWTRYNEVNANPANQCADLVEADGRIDTNPTANSKKDISGIFFPAYDASSIGGDAKIKLSFRSGGSTELALRNIRVENGAVRFLCVNLKSPMPVPSVAPPKDNDMLYIIAVVSDDGTLELMANNEVDASVKWYYNNAEVDNPKNFRPSASGTIRAEITWPDGSVDYLYKKHTVK